MEINDLLEAAARLEEAGIQAEVVKWNIITPLETELLIESVRKTGHLLVAEECVEQGCVGVRALAALEGLRTAAKTALVNCGTGYVPHGAVPILKKVWDWMERGSSAGRWRCWAVKNKKRLDVVMVERGLAESRQKAQAVIMAGQVFVDDQKVDKAGAPVTEGQNVEIRGKTLPYVSRGGLKLEKAMQLWPIGLHGAVCADIGASTGGFTDCMLQNGAQKVYAVDVRYNQLDYRLRTHPQVVVHGADQCPLSHPGTDPGSSELLFRGRLLHLPQPHPARAAAPDAGDWGGVCLVKPQFEAGKDKVGKKGVVRDPAVHLEVLEHFLEHAAHAGFSVKDITFSPSAGRRGTLNTWAISRSGRARHTAAT